MQWKWCGTLSIVIVPISLRGGMNMYIFDDELCLPLSGVHSSPKEVHIDFVQFSRWPWLTDPNPGAWQVCQMVLGVICKKKPLENSLQFSCILRENLLELSILFLFGRNQCALLLEKSVQVARVFCLGFTLTKGPYPPVVGPSLDPYQLLKVFDFLPSRQFWDCGTWNRTPYGILALWAVNGLSFVYWV